MTFNPDIHHRQSIRLRNYDYRNVGAYFVTVCAYQRECLFGEVVEEEVLLNEVGLAVERCLLAIPRHFAGVDLDACVIMPNHVHAVLAVNPAVRARHASPASVTRPLATDARATHASPLQESHLKPHSIGAIIGSFKSAAAKLINQLRDSPGLPVWQRNYYEHVIRNESDMANIRRYIEENPLKWAQDENNPVNIKENVPS